MSIYSLGISAYYHDSAAALLKDGVLIAAAQEERFTRKKHDLAFPKNAIRFCLDFAGIPLNCVTEIIYYEKPFIKFERLIETYLGNVPKGFVSFHKAMCVWLKEKLFLKKLLLKELSDLSGCPKAFIPIILYSEHHLSHAASAFFPSPFESSGILCLDGVGEWATTSVWHGKGNAITPLWQLDFPHSLGLLYSAFTYFTGFKVNSGEYKVMGLAPYGEPRYVAKILAHVLDLKKDGTFRLNLDLFNFQVGMTMTNERFAKLFDGRARQPESPLTQREMDLACSIQKVTEEIVVRLAKTVKKETGEKNLCLAGGVALNCVANGRIQRECGFDGIWIQPAAGDAGGAVGAAYAAWYIRRGNQRSTKNEDAMKGAFLGPAFNEMEIITQLTQAKAVYTRQEDNQLLPFVARLLDQGNVVGWFNGPMEYGPRALGARSILGDPRKPSMQSAMNLKIKYRESFRPFAPSVLAEKAEEYFGMSASSPYMLLVASVNENLQIPMKEEAQRLFGIDKLNVPRSTLPAITHIDYSARIQTVHEMTNPRYYKLIAEFEKLTGCAVVVNTSFNVRGEPIVCSPTDAYRCFMRTEMDYLVIENFILAKVDQPKELEAEDWKSEFILD